MTTHYGNMKVFSRHGVHEVTGAMIAKLSTEYQAIQNPTMDSRGSPKILPIPMMADEGGRVGVGFFFIFIFCSP